MKRSILLVLTLVLLLVLAPLALAADGDYPQDHARFRIDGTLYSIYRSEDGQQYVKSGDGSEMDATLPTGVSYDLETNNLTLTNAQLQTFEILYQVTDEAGEVVDYWLPNPDLTIELKNESTITSPGDYGMSIARGVNATVTGAADSSLALSVPAADGARAIRVEQNSTLTIAGETSVTATITGSFESEGYAEVIAMGVYESDLTVKDSATLTATADAVENNYSIDVVSGTMTVTDSAEVNANSTLALGRYEENDPLGKFIMNGESHLIIQDYDAGLMLNGAEVTVSGGDLDIDLTAPVDDYEQNTDEEGNVFFDINSWTNGILCSGSTMELRGGNVTIDFPNGNGISLDAAWDETGAVLGTSSLTQSGGTLTITANGESVDSNAISVSQTSADTLHNTATFTGGTAKLQARLGFNVGGNAVATLSDSANVQVESIANPYNWGTNLISGEMNVYGGQFTVNAVNSNALILNENSSYNQTAGNVKLTVTEPDFENNPAWAHGIMQETAESSITISGGTLDISSDYIGMECYGSFTLLGGTVNCYGANRSIVLVDTSEALLADGSLNASISETTGSIALHLLYSGQRPELTITGGEHTFLAPAGKDRDTIGLWAIGGLVSFEGGTVRATGDTAIEHYAEIGWHPNPEINQISLKGGMHAVSGVTGNELQFVYQEDSYEYENQTYFVHRYHYTEDSTEDGNLCTDVTISSEAGMIPVDYTGTMEITSGQATVGAPVVIKYTVATRGTVSISLPDSLELIAGSATVNGEEVSSLQNITVDGAAVIRFSVTPMNTNPAVITATATVGEKSYQTTLPVTASGFQASAPTITKVPLIYVTGYGTPGYQITLEVASTREGGNTVRIPGEVSSLGTFKIQVELPVKDPTKEENFTIKVYFANPNTRSGGTLGTTLEITYDPDSVSVTILSITNIVHNSNGWRVPVTVDVDYANNQVLQSYYTYWPDEPTFDFAVEFDVPEGWKIARAVVVVTYQGGATETVELEKPGPGDRNQWKGETDAPNPSKPPVSYKVGWIAIPEGSTVDISGMPLAYTAPTAFLPIMDPSGTVFSGTLDNPVPGATVTLYYGGNGKTADAAKAYVFDMTNYGQVNPQVSDALGHYAWNVPEGWWQIVATYELNGKTYTAKSDWLHVLPVQEGVGLDLNLLTVDPNRPHSSSNSKPAVPEAQDFRDVSENSYYYEAVTWAVANGVTEGTGSSTFSPDKACTRAEIVTFLWRAAGKPAAQSSVNPFTDVSKSDYYYEAVLWAVEAGITRGTSASTFSPDKTCTRAEAVTFLYRAADGKAPSGPLPFTDVTATAYYKDAVLWAVEENVTQGTGAHTFSPDKTCSRAEIVTFLYRSPLAQ